MENSKKVLIVEDNLADVKLIEEAFKSSGLKSEIYFAKDGVEAIEFLYNEGKFIDAPKPDLIILDLNLPRKNGKEVLEQIKKDPNLLQIPVVILTMSPKEEDFEDCYNMYANGYLIKPLDYDTFEKMIWKLEDYWFKFMGSHLFSGE